jgi:U32 family peptidase
VPDPGQRPITGGRAIASPAAPAAQAAQAAQSPSTTRRGQPEPPEPPDDTDLRTRVVPRAGMGVVFDRARPRDPEEGGPIFAVVDDPLGHWLRFGRPGPDLANVQVGNLVWITSDPKVTRAGEKAAEAGRLPLGRIAIDLTVRGAVGTPLEVVAVARGLTPQGFPRAKESQGLYPAVDRRSPIEGGGDPDGCAGGAGVLPRGIDPLPSVTVQAGTPTLLQAAKGVGLLPNVVVDKLGAFGGTPFRLGSITTEGLAAGLHVPISELKELRRVIVQKLCAAIARGDRPVAERSVIEELRRAYPPIDHAPIDHAPIIVPLCRTDAQLDAVLEAGATEVELDWMELVGLGKAVARARARGVRVGVATMRVQKPGEERIDQHLASLAPDHVLVRSWGSLAAFVRLPHPPILHGDFSLNVTNSIAAGWVLEHGLATLTAAHDLDREQLFALLARTPRGRIGVTIHHHVPTFHTEHCVYAHLLSTGRDYKTCGRPCEQHQVALRDRIGLVHPVVVDVGCRNTVFNAQAQSAASLVPELLAQGVRRFRVELVRETAQEAARVFTDYTKLAAGQLDPREVVRRAAVHEQFGVTRGTMRTLTVLR